MGPNGHNAEGDLAAIANADTDPNPTMVALAEAFPMSQERAVADRIPFSSERKMSAVAFSDGSGWVVGAPEIVLGSAARPALEEKVRALAERGRRAVLVGRCDPKAIGNGEIADVEPAYLLEFVEQLRPDAHETVGYFTDQDVTLKVISGDSPVTVAAVARSAGIPGTGVVDARAMPDDQAEFAAAAETTAVFGRVTPERKRQLVDVLMDDGHVVAMTGDGVNDVLAVKDADLGIAMGAGSGATRAVSQIVLLDNKFSALPFVVAEGRRVVANMERVSSLFLTKTVYATILAIAIGFVGLAFPFLPRHLTLIGSLTIGIPAFFLSFEPQDRPIRDGFIQRVLAFALPAGVVTGLATFLLYGVSRNESLGLTPEQSSTAATTLMVVLGLVVLYELIEPPDIHHLLMIGGLFVIYLFVLAVPFLRDLFSLTVPAWQAWVVIAVVALVAGLALKLLWTLAKGFIVARYGIDAS